MKLKPGETLDDLVRNGMKVIQAGNGYRFSMDSVLLADFALVRSGDKVLDVGCGSGVVSFLLASRQPSCRITGLEIQPELADRARRGVKLNGLADKIEIIDGDLRQAKVLFENRRFNLIVANPPFWRKGEGKPNPDREKLVARHEVYAMLEDYVEMGRDWLASQGRLAIIHRADRTAEIVSQCADRGLNVKRFRFVHPYRERDAKLVLIEAVKGSKAGVRILPPLVVYESNGNYTEEILGIYS